MGETNSLSVAHVGYDISPFKRVKFKILTTSRHATEGESIFPLSEMIAWYFHSLKWLNDISTLWSDNMIFPLSEVTTMIFPLSEVIYGYHCIKIM